MLQTSYSTRQLLLALLVTGAAIALVTAISPVERTLGEVARLIYFHGAWVWAGKFAFAAAALSGLVGLLLPATKPWRAACLRASLACGWVGMFFWLTYLPQSLMVQQMSWGGIFWDEPRWRVPFTFGIVGLLLQIGLSLVENLRLAALANLLFGAALWAMLGNVQNILHPDSPIFGSDATSIQVFFVVLVGLALLFGALLARLLYQRFTARWHA